jgi:hypothetical protein
VTDGAVTVTSVSADSVFVSPNEYETNKMSGIHEIDKAENYLTFLMVFQKAI